MFKTYLNENTYIEALYLMSQFTIGFELEAYMEPKYFEDLVKFSQQYFANQSNVFKRIAKWKDDPTINPEGIKECKACDGSGQELDAFDDYTGNTCDECEGDGFIIPDYDGDLKTFEYTSDVFYFTPKILQSIITFLDEIMNKFTVSTNDTCGFHIHIGFPDTKQRDLDMFWIILNLAMDPGMIKFITEFKGFEFKSKRFADDQYLKLLRKAINNLIDNVPQDISYITPFYTNAKYVILRQHPQGTLEWRGPRNFLNTKNKTIIKKFFINRLYPLIKWFNDTLEKTELYIDKNLTLQKSHLQKVLKNYNSTVKSGPKKFEGMNNEEIKKILKKFPWIRKAKFIRTFMLEVDETLFIKRMNLLSGDLQSSVIEEIHTSSMGTIYNSHILSGDTEHTSFNNCKINTIYSNEGQFLNCEFIPFDINDYDFKISYKSSQDSCTLRDCELDNCSNVNSGNMRLDLSRCIVKNNELKNLNSNNSKIFNSNIALNFPMNNEFFDCTISRLKKSNVVSMTFYETQNIFKNCVIISDEIFNKDMFENCIFENVPLFMNCTFKGNIQFKKIIIVKNKEQTIVTNINQLKELGLLI